MMRNAPDSGDVELQPPARSSLLPALFLVVEVLRARWRFVSLTTLLVGLLAATTVLLIPHRYRSDAAFVVDSPAGGLLPGGVLSLIGQVTGANDAAESPDFYVSLVTSRPVLDTLLLTRPKSQCGEQGSSRFLDILRASGDTPAESLFNGRKMLKERITASADFKTGIIGVSLEANCPEQARELLDSLLAALDRFNVDTRQTRAREQRQFAEAQLHSAEVALREAEDNLESFLTRNRAVESPQLRMQEDRLQREINREAALTQSLDAEYTKAKIDELNSTPTITRIAPPSTPVEPSWPKRRLIVAFMLVVGALVSIIVVVWHALLHGIPNGSERFQETRRSAMQRLRSVLP